jgi:hypothetical protein
MHFSFSRGAIRPDNFVHTDLTIRYFVNSINYEAHHVIFCLALFLLFLRLKYSPKNFVVKYHHFCYSQQFIKIRNTCT